MNSSTSSETEFEGVPGQEYTYSSHVHRLFAAGAFFSLTGGLLSLFDFFTGYTGVSIAGAAGMAAGLLLLNRWIAIAHRESR